MKFPAWLKVKRQEKFHDHMELTLELDLDAYLSEMARTMEAEEVRQAGVEARMYVRGAMDPEYATPEARDAYVKTLYPGQAAAFLRGWVEHHPEEDWPELSGVCMCGATIGPDRFCGEPYHTPMDQAAYLWYRRQ